MTGALILLFLLSLGIMIYHHVIYPVFLSLININRHSLPHYTHRHYSATPQDHCSPTIHIFIPAYNEAKYIRDKIQNLTIIDYPEDKLKITIICDGSTDHTHDIAKEELFRPECKHLNANVVQVAKNAGKIAIINRFIPECRADIVVLSDVSALVSSNSLLIIASYFEQHEQTGAVCGSYQFVPSSTTGEQLYWDYQRKIKIQESIMGSTIGLHGAFYAFRRSLFHAIPPDTINDDVIIPLNIVKQGYQCLYDPRLITIELEPSSHNMDFQRRIRIAEGNAQQSHRYRELIHPRYGKFAFNFFSGKFLRPIMPVLLAVSLIVSGVLSLDYLLFKIIFSVQIIIYGQAIFYLTMKIQPKSKLTRILFYIISGHLAMGIGLLNFITKKTHDRWYKICQK